MSLKPQFCINCGAQRTMSPFCNNCQSSHPLNSERIDLRKLDLEVAEKVMEKTYGPRFPLETPSSHASWYGPCDGFLDGRCSVCAGQPERPPFYSTDIVSALSVLEKIKSSGATIRWDQKSGLWGVFIGAADAADKSLPLAICKAALEAVK